MKVLGVDFPMRSGELKGSELSLVVVNEENNIEMVNHIKTNKTYKEIAITIGEMSNQYGCDKIVVNNFGFVGDSVFLELREIISNGCLVEHSLTSKATHDILFVLQETKILEEWGVPLKFNIICGHIRLEKEFYTDKKEWVSLAMATGLALKTIMDEKKRQEDIKYRNSIKEKLEDYMRNNDFSILNIGITKSDNYYEYSTGYDVDDIVNVFADVLNS